MSVKKFALISVILLGGVVLFYHGEWALNPAIPVDMPRDSHFARAGYDLQRNEAKGDWIACRTDAAESADFCRVTDARGTVIYQGDFLPVSSSVPVPASQLHVAEIDDKNLWAQGPAEAGPVPIIPLVDGTILVPAQDAYAFGDRWNNNPDELARLESD